MVKPETSDFLGNELDKAKLEIVSYWKDKYEKTQKALDVAKDKLDTVRQYYRGTAVIRPDNIAAYCDKALEQITALEQKEVK